MADHNDHTRTPLANVIVCFTGVDHEERKELIKFGSDMGATHTFDLTSEVTHLVVGDPEISAENRNDIYTTKYKYVARMRADVKVMSRGWLRAMHARWLAGEDNVWTAEISVEHKYPALAGLRICVTGISDMDERKRVQAAVETNGGRYYPDLMKLCTHLICTAPTGKKYEFAVRDKIPVVDVQWLWDSVERGMALDEGCYNIAMSREKIGLGAKPEPVKVDVSQLNAQPKRRKLRKAASQKLESQHSQLWDQILKGVHRREEVKTNDWEENVQVEDSVMLPTKEASPAIRPKTGIMKDAAVYLKGFTTHQISAIRKFVEPLDASIVSSLQLLVDSDLQYRICIVPRSTHLRECPQVPEQPGLHVVTEWWLEYVIHNQAMAEPSEYPIALPFKEHPIEGFEDMTISITQFSGIELRHYMQLIPMLGAKFYETLVKGRSLLVTNLPARGDKLRFAISNNIPVVTKAWLESCVAQTTMLPYGEYLCSAKKRKRPTEESTSVKPSVSPITGPLAAGPNPALGDRFKIPARKQNGGDGKCQDDAERPRKKTRSKTPEEGAGVGGSEGKGRFPRPKGDPSKSDSRTQPKPLTNFVVAISPHIKGGDHKSLSALAKILGATTAAVTQKGISRRRYTHLIVTAPLDFSPPHPCYQVTPSWLNACRTLGSKAPESQYTLSGADESAPALTDKDPNCSRSSREPDSAAAQNFSATLSRISNEQITALAAPPKKERAKPCGKAAPNGPSIGSREGLTRASSFAGSSEKATESNSIEQLLSEKASEVKMPLMDLLEDFTAQEKHAEGEASEAPMVMTQALAYGDAEAERQRRETQAMLEGRRVSVEVEGVKKVTQPPPNATRRRRRKVDVDLTMSSAIGESGTAQAAGSAARRSLRNR